MKQIITLCLVVLALTSCKKDAEINEITTIIPFRAHGLDVAWDLSGSNRIAYSQKGADQFYDVHLVDPTGLNDVCLTCDNALTPNKHICCPYWHPSGEWLMLVIEKETHPGSSTDALPGFGAYCDIWVMNKTATKAYKIVDIPNDYDHGVIAPRFSHDGKQIVWTDRKTRPNLLNGPELAGYWVIKIADFKFGAADSIPVVSNIRTIEPISNAFYECYGFSPDDSRLIFCSNIGQPSFLNEHIYTIDTLGGQLKQLTTKDYNEHGFYSPDGRKIVFMSSTESTKHGTDWWMMNTDGSNKIRLTYMNEPASSQYAGHAVWAGLGAFAPEGDRFISGYQESLITQEGRIVMVELH